MGRLFLFGIGGTGSRVIKALTMLLAAGVEINTDTIVPILIDPDENNGDLLRTLDILSKYQKINKHVVQEKSSFFKTKIVTLDEISNADDGVQANFLFKLSNVSNKRFSEYMGLENLSKENKALVKSLFTAENLDSSMDVGFKGNPNIGSVVLNQMKSSKEFNTFVSNITEDDRIFIISSIFGGTGAAGFPLLVKNFREADTISELQEKAKILKKSKIAAVCVMPYFGVESDKSSKINKATFISKTKAALKYYERNLTGNNSLNSLYYIGDIVTKDYENHEGSKAQKNDAHFVELAAALSIIDFMNMEDSNLIVNNNGKVETPRYKEFGVNDGSSPLNFNKLGMITRRQLFKPLTKFMLLNLYQAFQLQDSIDKQPWSKRGNTKLSRLFFEGEFYKKIIDVFINYFDEWFEEMARNEVSFTPFNLGVNGNNILELVYDMPRKDPGFFDRIKYGSNPLAYFDDRLNMVEYTKAISNKPVNSKFILLFDKTLDIIFDENFQA